MLVLTLVASVTNPSSAAFGHISETFPESK